MKLNNKFMRTFAIFASVLMLTIVAMPMVAAEEPTTPEITLYNFDGSEIKIIDGLPHIIVETEDGYVNIPFPLSNTMDMMADGVPITVEVDGNYLLIPTEDGIKRVCISEFDVELVDGELMLVHEVNPAFIIPILIIKKALILAGIPVTAKTIAAAKTVASSLILARISLTAKNLAAAIMLTSAGVPVTATTVPAAIKLKSAGVPVTATTVPAAVGLISAGVPVTATTVAAVPIIKRALIGAGVIISGHVLDSALRDWFNGRCIMPQCERINRGGRMPINPSGMVCVAFPRC